MPPIVFTGRSFSAATVCVLPFICTLYSCVPIFAVPPGRIRFCALIAFTTSIGASPFACSARVSRSTTIWRILPPNGSGTAAPWTVASCVRMKLLPRSYSCCSASVSLDSPSCRIGTVDALYVMMFGGSVPGGRMRRIDAALLAASAIARLMSAPGWKKIFTTDTPFSDCDSMCSMSSTSDVSARS